MYDYLYRTEELYEWVPEIKEMMNRVETLHLIFKNKHADYPVSNALEMKRLLRLT